MKPDPARRLANLPKPRYPDDLPVVARREEIARAQRNASTPIPEGFDYAGVRGLSAELAQKLIQVRPLTVGQAQRIPGMTPAAISLLLVHLERARRVRAA